jgi:hypothetical protein
MKQKPVAALKVAAITAGGERVTLTARVGAPYSHRDGGFACAVEIAPLYAELEDVRGVDSFHAVWLACSLILKLLGHFKSQGGQLANEDGSEFPLEAYLTGL